jgi:hypothetical protein
MANTVSAAFLIPTSATNYKTLRFSTRSPTRSSKAPRSAVFSIVATLTTYLPRSRIPGAGASLDWDALPWPPPSNSASSIPDGLYELRFLTEYFFANPYNKDLSAWPNADTNPLRLYRNPKTCDPSRRVQLKRRLEANSNLWLSTRLNVLQEVLLEGIDHAGWKIRSNS